MAPQVILLGAGGHGRSLFETLIACGTKILAIADRDPAKVRENFPGTPVMEEEDALSAHDPGDIFLVNGIGGAGDTGPRRNLFDRLHQRGFRFATVIHPSAVIASGVTLDEGAQVLAGAIIQTAGQIGENSLINIGAVIDHDNRTGAHCHIAPGVAISGNVRIGEATHVGTGASVIQDLTIGRNCIIGAGAVVVKDVPDNTTAIGVPARW
jgi:UDP-perosamine 4-acetyltransferase